MITNKKQSSNFIKLLLTVVFVFSITSCESVKEKKYKSSNLELRQLVKETETIKTTSGYYFLIGGGFDSSENKITTVKVFANVEDRYRLIEMPIEDIRINIDNNITHPFITVEYRKINKETDEKLLNMPWIEKTYIINCQEQYLPERLLPINL